MKSPNYSSHYNSDSPSGEVGANNPRKLNKLVVGAALVAVGFGAGTQVDLPNKPSTPATQEAEGGDEAVNQTISQLFARLEAQQENFSNTDTDASVAFIAWNQDGGEIHLGFENQTLAIYNGKLIAEFRPLGNTVEDNVTLGLVLEQNDNGGWQLEESVFVDNEEREELRTVALISSPDDLEPIATMLGQADARLGD